MLDVRVVSPPGTTDRLVERLSADRGVRNLVVQRGAARRPEYGAITATALGLDKRDRRATRHGLAALGGGFALRSWSR